MLTSTRRRVRVARLLRALIVVSGMTAIAWPASLGAVPLDDLRAKASAIAAELDANGAKAAALGEQLNAAQIELDEAQAQIVDAEVRTQEAEGETDRLRALVHTRAVSIYRRGGMAILPELDASDASEALVREKYAEAATGRDRALLDELAAARADLAARRADAQRVRDAAQKEREALASAKAEADAAAAAQEQLLQQVRGQMAQLVREEQARREAAQAAAAPKTQSKAWDGPVPDPSAGAAAAVAFARAQLGKPYEYAASGPDTYDCSGLTMRAWQAGGISMPHYSGAQAAMFPRVPLDQLQPGDLITSSSWPAHIGIWVGDGFIHATHTGDVIRFVAGRSSVRDAVRPG